MNVSIKLAAYILIAMLGFQALPISAYEWPTSQGSLKFAQDGLTAVAKTCKQYFGTIAFAAFFSYCFYKEYKKNSIALLPDEELLSYLRTDRIDAALLQSFSNNIAALEKAQTGSTQEIANIRKDIKQTANSYIEYKDAIEKTVAQLVWKQTIVEKRINKLAQSNQKQYKNDFMLIRDELDTLITELNRLKTLVTSTDQYRREVSAKAEANRPSWDTLKEQENKA